MRLSDYIATSASLRPDDIAFIDGKRTVRLGEAAATIDAIAHALHAESKLAASLTPHVAIYSPNDHRVSLLQAGVNRADFVFIGVHTRNAVAVNIEQLRFFDAEMLFFHSYYADIIPELKAALPKVSSWICIDAPSDHGLDLETWLAPHRRPFPVSLEDPLTRAFMAPTGGTTGPSKGVVHTHRSLEMATITVSTGFGFDRHSRYLAVAPMTHAGGMMVLASAASGGRSVIMNEFEPGAVLAAVTQHGITHMFLPPTALYALLAHPDIERTDLTSMRCLILGAAPTAPAKFREAFRIFGPILYEGYGQSECAAGVLIKKPEDYILPDGSLDDAGVRATGRSTRFSRVELMDDDGNLLPPGQPGEIVLLSSMAMLGYYKNPEATAEIVTNGWRRTGDVAIRDASGLVTIIDRKKDMIISGGFNIFPAQIENCIGSHPAVLDCAVIGVPHEKWGEAVMAVVVRRPGCMTDEATLIMHCKQELGSVCAPKSVEFWDALPRSAVGKVLRREVRAKFWTNEWRAV